MATVAASTLPVVRPRLNHVRLAFLSFFWFGIQAHWAAILLITLPQQALLMGGDQVKGQTLGLILAFGAIISMVVAPLFGALSDRIVTPLGRRRPWMIVGTAMNILGLLALAYIPKANDLGTLPLYVLAFLWVEFWNNAANAPFNALIPDLVPKEQRGTASGWFGIMYVLGSFVGAATGILFTSQGKTDITAIYYFLSIVLFLSMLGTVLTIREPVVAPPREPFRLKAFWLGMLSPLKDHDFRWVFWTRFLWVMGTFTVQEFLQYYMHDVVQVFTFFGQPIASNAEAAVSVFGAALLLGAVVPSLLAGILSDRFGRKVMVYISSGLQALVPITMIFFTSFDVAILLGILFGIGYGAYQAVDWAMASDVLPSEEDYARDMGVWHIAWAFPSHCHTDRGRLARQFPGDRQTECAAEPGVYGRFLARSVLPAAGHGARAPGAQGQIKRERHE